MSEKNCVFFNACISLIGSASRLHLRPICLLMWGYAIYYIIHQKNSRKTRLLSLLSTFSLDCLLQGSRFKSQRPCDGPPYYNCIAMQMNRFRNFKMHLSFSSYPDNLAFINLPSLQSRRSLNVTCVLLKLCNGLMDNSVHTDIVPWHVT